MTLRKRLRSLFFRNAPASPVPVVLTVAPVLMDKPLSQQSESEPNSAATLTAFSKPEPLPNWLSDEESLRDEGVLVGLSGVRPDGQLAQIRAAFAQQSAPLEELIEQYAEKIGEINLFIEQCENQIIALRDQISDLRNSQSTPNTLMRTVVSLVLSVVMCIGNFYLIDQTLYPFFPNRWITVGVFLAGMFNLFGRTSFFYETATRLSGRRMIEEVGLPLAASVFILVYSLQTQSVGLTIGLFIFVFFVFLLSGKLLLSTLTTLQNDVNAIQKNRRLAARKEQNGPAWESEQKRLDREIDALRTRKWPVVTALNQAQANLNRLNAHRDRLINLFLSEFELARSLRERRNLMMNYE